MISDSELQELEDAIAHAIHIRDDRSLRLLGHGEISIVVGWPAACPELACKRLPPFPSAALFDRYADVVHRYVRRLRSTGVRTLDTDVRRLVRPDGSVVGFHVQPALPADRIADRQLAATEPASGHPLVAAVVDAVVRGTGADHGIDAQLSNWAWLDGEVLQLDLTTPFLLDPDGRLAMPLAPFLASLPAAARPIVEREMQQLARRWLTPRGAFVDLVANLFKSHLDRWVGPVLEEVNRAVPDPVTADEARRVHASDRRLWPLLLRLQKLERWWSGSVRRRPYEFLLPEKTTYG